MASFTYGLGKGLQEPVYPFREAYAFGAALNDFSADGWNAIPRIYAPATTFDLSTISPGREVAVALLGINNTSAGDYTIRFKWTRDRDNALLYEYEHSISPPTGAWLYAYSYIGWVDWEIKENGAYHVDIEVSGPDSFSRRLNFNITGITPGPVPLPEPVEFMSGIIDRLDSAADYMRVAWREVDSWIWPFYLLAPALRGLEEAFNWLVYHFIEFGNWVNDVGGKVSGILGQGDIIGLLRTWLNYAEWAWSWVSDAGANVAGIIDSWWSSTMGEVQVLIDEAKRYADALMGQLVAGIDDLLAGWNSFKSKIPTLDAVVSWWADWTGNVQASIDSWWSSTISQVQAMIDSAFTERASWWDGWLDFRDRIIEFFSDPWEWLWLKFTDWFLGPEE